jgi:ATP/maltotriose-dependent transcriptional regulator MalT
LNGTPQLSRRECQVLQLICRRYSDKQIAEELKISVATVKWHIRELFSKLSEPNRVGLALQWAQLSKDSLAVSLPSE